MARKKKKTKSIEISEEKPQEQPESTSEQQPAADKEPEASAEQAEAVMKKSEVKGQPEGEAQPETIAEQPETVAEEKPASAPAHPPIRKGIYLSALIYLEGDQPPAENFDPVAIDALRETLTSCFTEQKSGLTMTLKTIDVRNDIEQEEEEEEEEEGEEKPKEKKEKFQF